MKNDNGKINFFNIIMVILIICVIALVISQYNTFNKKPNEEQNLPVENNVPGENLVIEDSEPTPPTPEEINSQNPNLNLNDPRLYIGEYFIDNTSTNAEDAKKPNAKTKASSLVLKDNNDCKFNLEYNNYLVGKYELKDNKIIAKFTSIDSPVTGTVQKVNINATFELVSPSSMKAVSVENTSKDIIKDENLKNVLEANIVYSAAKNNTANFLKYDTYKLDNLSKTQGGTYKSCTIDILGQKELSINFNKTDSLSATYTISDKKLVAKVYFSNRVKDKMPINGNANIELTFDIINMDTLKLDSIKPINYGVFNENDFKGIIEKDLTYSVKQASAKK